MLGKEIYKIYAPKDAKWTNWVRPVPFVAIDTYNRKTITNWKDKKQMFLTSYAKDTAIGSFVFICRIYCYCHLDELFK